MNPSPKDEVKGAIHLVCKGSENAERAKNDLALESEERAQDLAISNSLILAPRHELLRTEAGLKREAEEVAHKLDVQVNK
jgi:hypothetical protein